jgi:hypothetical protein
MISRALLACLAGARIRRDTKMRRNPLDFTAAALVGAGLALSAFSAAAAPVTSFSTAPVTDVNAIGDDPQLAGRVLNLMNVNVGGNDWTNSSIRIQLASGTVYNATNAVGTVSTPAGISAFWTTPGFRNGPFDSFVNSKGTGTIPGDATVLGGVDPAGAPTPVGTEVGLATANATLVAIQWGNTVATDTGSFSVGRFTLSANATGTFFGQSFDSLSGGVGTPFNGTIAAGVMTLVPEPTSLGLLGLVAGGLLRRRRTA